MEPLSEAEGKAILEESHFGYLGLADGGRSYVIPLFFGYDGEACYFQSHPGLKDGFIDATKEACLTVSHVESHHIWESVQVFGALEKVTLTNDRTSAQNALIEMPLPPLPGNYPKGMPKRGGENMYYLKLTPTRYGGKKSTYSEPEV